MLSETDIPLNSTYMRMFEQPIIFNFNPDYDLYLSKKSFKIISPTDFNILSLPNKFKQISMTELKQNETFREKIPGLFKIVPKEILVPKDPRMKAFSDSLFVPLLTPPEFQGGSFYVL
jgi:hypothetical protein